MKIGYKVWLDNNGKAFGDGPYELLSRVEENDVPSPGSQSDGHVLQQGMAFNPDLGGKAWFCSLENGKSGANPEEVPRSPPREKIS